MTTQLRRYEIEPGELDAFVAWWRETLWPARREFGFTLDFAYALADESAFVWAVSHDGGPDDYAAAEASWFSSAERAAAFAGVPQRIASSRVGFVERVA